MSNFLRILCNLGFESMTYKLDYNQNRAPSPLYSLNIDIIYIFNVINITIGY